MMKRTYAVSRDRNSKKREAEWNGKQKFNQLHNRQRKTVFLGKSQFYAKHCTHKNMLLKGFAAVSLPDGILSSHGTATAKD